MKFLAINNKIFRQKTLKIHINYFFFFLFFNKSIFENIYFNNFFIKEKKLLNLLIISFNIKTIFSMKYDF